MSQLTVLIQRVGHSSIPFHNQGAIPKGRSSKLSRPFCPRSTIGRGHSNARKQSLTIPGSIGGNITTTAIQAPHYKGTDHGTKTTRPLGGTTPRDFQNARKSTQSTRPRPQNFKDPREMFHRQSQAIVPPHRTRLSLAKYSFYVNRDRTKGPKAQFGPGTGFGTNHIVCWDNPVWELRGAQTQKQIGATPFLKAGPSLGNTRAYSTPH